MIVQIIKATPEYVQVIAENCREQDRAEFWAHNRSTPLKVLETGLRVSTVAYVGIVDGVPMCMFGVAPYSFLAGQGIPWMVSTNALDARSRKLRRAVMAISIDVIDEFKKLFPSLLFNAVDDRNESAKNWLRWLGFKLLPPTPYGIDRLPFRPFYWSCTDV